MNLLQILIFFPVGIFAGICGTVVGIASLASYPALLLAGLPPVVANMTNLTSQIFIGLGSIQQSAKDLKGHFKQTMVCFGLVLIGGFIGANIVSVESSASFAKIVPFFILIAAGLILRPEKQHQRKDHTKKQLLWLDSIAYFAIFMIGIYCGYFGAASGVVFMALLSTISHNPFRVNSSIRNIAILGASFSSIAVFIIHARIYWPVVLPLGLGMLIGGYVGPIIVRKVNQKYLKRVIAACALALSIYLFIKAYR